MKIGICKNCNKTFEYKYTNRGNSCSPACTVAIISKSKIKYTEDQINKVISLKKEGVTNKNIVLLTGVKLSKVKEIVKNACVLLSPEKRQSNAYQTKLIKNPNSMEDMRNKYKEKTISEKTINNIKIALNEMGYEYVSGFCGKSKPFYIK